MKLSFAVLAVAGAQQATHTPTTDPTTSPTKYPTKFPTSQPTESPTVAADQPTNQPTQLPTIPQDCTVKLYKNCFYDGYVGTFGHGNQYADLGQLAKDAVGGPGSAGNNAGGLEYAFNNDISSVKIEGNCAIYMYDHANYGGLAKVLTQDAPCLVDTQSEINAANHANYFNDKVSSFKVASMFMDSQDTAAQDGNKWVANEEYDHRVVMVKNTPYVTSLIDGRIMKFTNSDYPANLHHRQRYVLSFVNGGIAPTGDAVPVDCGAEATDYCLGDNLQFTYNGMTARLVTPTQTAHEAFVAENEYPVMIQNRQGKDVAAKLMGDQMNWKKDGNHMRREHTSDPVANADCHVELFEECNYQGTPFDYYPGHYSHAKQDMTDLTVKSLRIHGDCQVRLYDEKNFGGEEREIRVNQECMDATILEEFNSQVLSHAIVDGVWTNAADSKDFEDSLKYDAHGATPTYLREGGPKASLRVASLELVHFDYPTPFPTTFPTASPTYALDMPACPLSCTYHAHVNGGQDMNKGHMISVIHSKDIMPAWRSFRATYPNVLSGEHNCWHELPGGVDEDQDGTPNNRNHQDFHHHEDPAGGNTGGCHCRCS